MINHEWQAIKTLLLCLFFACSLCWFFGLGLAIGHYFLLDRSAPTHLAIYLSWK